MSSAPDSSATPDVRRRRRIVSIQVLPTLITAANLVAGLLALSYLMDAAAAGADEALRDSFLVKASWLVFVGMFCDALDGRIARMTGTTSSFGAQLDSLADVVTFGVTPALIARAYLGYGFPNVAGKILVGLAVVYMVGAALRLARYNVETARIDAEGDGAEHVTHVFRGLPSPAAAGVIAMIVLLHHKYEFKSIEWLLLAMTPILGLLMVSRMPYTHVMNRYFDGRRPLGTVVFLVVVVFFMSIYFEATVAAAFLLYALSGPALTLLHRISGWPSWVVQEEEDEAPGARLLLHPNSSDEDTPRSDGTHGESR